MANLQMRSLQGRSDVENPLANGGEDVSLSDFRMTESEYVDEDIGRKSVFDGEERDDDAFNPQKMHQSEKVLSQWIGPLWAHYARCFFLALFILPLALYFLVIKLKTFVVVGVFNYTGFNMRPYLYFDIPTERDTELLVERYSRGPVSWGKIKYISQRYMTYWIVIIALICALKFINKVDIFDVVGKYEIYKRNKTVSHLVSILVSILLGFANIIPTRAVRPDISAFISSFTEMDIVIRDSSHTRLKDLTEVLEDLKQHHFAFFNTDAGCSIIVSTRVPEELNDLPGFAALLNSDAFDNNNIIRFIQIEEDVDSFFVVRNDIGVCHRVAFNPFQWSDVQHDLHNFRLRVQISDLELNLYGGVSLVLLVVLFSATQHLPTTSILIAWAILPVVFALIYRRKQSKLASINFFTLNGQDRVYQPFNNIQISTDKVIQKRIAEFKFINTLFKISPQGKFLVHIVLKCAESCRYQWLIHGFKVTDFRRLAAMAATLHQTDIGIVTPSARMFLPAPKHYKLKQDACVVFHISAVVEENNHKKALVRSTPMTKAHFESAFNTLPYGPDKWDFEQLFLC